MDNLEELQGDWEEFAEKSGRPGEDDDEEEEDEDDGEFRLLSFGSVSCCMD